MGATDRILTTHGAEGLYTSTLFRYDDRVLQRLNPALELGRSFVRAEYQRSYAALALLWKGIGQIVLRSPRLPHSLRPREHLEPVPRYVAAAPAGVPRPTARLEHRRTDPGRPTADLLCAAGARRDITGDIDGLDAAIRVWRAELACRSCCDSIFSSTRLFSGST